MTTYTVSTFELSKNGRYCVNLNVLDRILSVALL